MKKFWDKLDPIYTKKAVYAGVTAVITVAVLAILYASRGVWGTVWQLVSAVFKPLILGGVFCYLLMPMVDFFDDKLKGKKKKEWNSRGLAVVLSLLIVFLIITGVFAVIIWTMTKQLRMVDYSSVVAIFEDAQSDMEGLISQVEEYFTKLGIDVPAIGTKVTGVAAGIAGGASNLFFGLIVAVYFLIDGKRIGSYWRKVGQVLLTDKRMEELGTIGKEADRCFSGYIRGQAIDALIVGTIASIALILVKMPYAFLVGMIIGIGNMIPYVGPIMGYGAVILINVTQFNLRMLIIGLIIIAVIMFIDGNILNPKLLAGAIKVHPLLVVISLLAGGAIGGIVGMLIAVPTGAFVKLQFEKWIANREAAL